MQFAIAAVSLMMLTQPSWALPTVQDAPPNLLLHAESTGGSLTNLTARQATTTALIFGITRPIDGFVGPEAKAALQRAGLSVNTARANAAKSGSALLPEIAQWPEHPQTHVSPSHISQRVFKASAFQYGQQKVSMMNVAWGQFAAHDMIETSTTNTRFHFPQTEICRSAVSTKALMCTPQNATLSISRLATVGSGADKQGRNGQTPYLDASGIYGGTEARAGLLRTFEDGKLISDPATGLPANRMAAPVAGPVDPMQQLVGGDPRSNMNPGLIALGGLFVLEHNRKCDELKQSHPEWTDDQLYQTARRFVTALIQRFTYYQYMTTVVGAPAAAYDGYDDSAEARVDAFFAVAAYRYGHSGINRVYLRESASGEMLSPIMLDEAYFNPYAYISSTTELEPLDGGGPITGRAIGPILRGLTKQREAEIDLNLVADVHERLFEAPFDLVAIDVARGRDVGLPSYVEARRYFGLSVPTSWSEICGDGRSGQLLQQAYGGNLSLVDAWVGGLCETPVANGMVGPLFAASIRRTMERVRSADPWWYEREGILTAEELEEVQRTSLTDVVNRNTRAGMSDDPFRVSTETTSSSGTSSGGSTSTGGTSGGGTTTDGTVGSSVGVGEADFGGAVRIRWRLYDSAGLSSSSFEQAGLTSTAGAVGIELELLLTGTGVTKGWVGLGIGSSMADADVMTCEFDIDTSTATVADRTSGGYAEPSRDSSQVDIVRQRLVSRDGEHGCAFVRRVTPSSPSNKALDTSKAQSFILAWGQGSSTVGYHGGSKRVVSMDLSKVGAASAEAVLSSSSERVYGSTYMAHGAIMGLCWAVIMPGAVLLLMVMKTQRLFWLDVHQFAMVLVLSLSIPTAAAAFGASEGRSVSLHTVLGISICALTIVLEFMGAAARYFHARDGVEPPWVFRRFKSLHKMGGYMVFIVAQVNVTIGVRKLWPVLFPYVISYMVTIMLTMVAVGISRTSWGLKLITSGVEGIRRRSSMMPQVSDAEQRKAVVMPCRSKGGEPLRALPSSVSTTVKIIDSAGLLVRRIPRITARDFNRRCDDGEHLTMIRGFIFDIAGFAEQHPGSAWVINRAVRRDVTEQFFGQMSIHARIPKHKHSEYSEVMLTDMLVGQVEAESEKSIGDSAMSVSEPSDDTVAPAATSGQTMRELVKRVQSRYGMSRAAVQPSRMLSDEGDSEVWQIGDKDSPMRKPDSKPVGKTQRFAESPNPKTSSQKYAATPPVEATSKTLTPVTSASTEEEHKEQADLPPRSKWLAHTARYISPPDTDPRPVVMAIFRPDDDAARELAEMRRVDAANVTNRTGDHVTVTRLPALPNRVSRPYTCLAYDLTQMAYESQTAWLQLAQTQTGASIPIDVVRRCFGASADRILTRGDRSATGTNVQLSRAVREALADEAGRMVLASELPDGNLALGVRVYESGAFSRAFQRDLASIVGKETAWLDDRSLPRYSFVRSSQPAADADLAAQVQAPEAPGGTPRRLHVVVGAGTGVLPYVNLFGAIARLQSSKWRPMMGSRVLVRAVFTFSDPESAVGLPWLCAAVLASRGCIEMRVNFTRITAEDDAARLDPEASGHGPSGWCPVEVSHVNRMHTSDLMDTFAAVTQSASGRPVLGPSQTSGTGKADIADRASALLRSMASVEPSNTVLERVLLCGPFQFCMGAQSSLGNVAIRQGVVGSQHEFQSFVKLL